MLDKQRGKLGGVCAGLSNYLGINAAWVRVGVLVLHAVFSDQITLIWVAYLLAIIVTPVKPLMPVTSSFDDLGHQIVSSQRSLANIWGRYHALEPRLARIERYYTSHNTSLARQIDALGKKPNSNTRAMQLMIDVVRQQAQTADTADFEV